MSSWSVSSVPGNFTSLGATLSAAALLASYSLIVSEFFLKGVYLKLPRKVLQVQSFLIPQATKKATDLMAVGGEAIVRAIVYHQIS